MGRRIRARRVENGMSQSALAEQLGVSFQQLQKYEKGVNRVGAARLQRIAAALGVDVTFFMTVTARKGKSRACCSSTAISASDCCVLTLLSKIKRYSGSLLSWSRWLRRRKVSLFTTAGRMPEGVRSIVPGTPSTLVDPRFHFSSFSPFPLCERRAAMILRPQLACSRSMSRVI